jgi:ABC-type multidrug transport system permease subunit
MLGDVVKTKSFLLQIKSKLSLFIVFITLLWGSLPTVKKIYKYTQLTQTCPITVCDIVWQKPSILLVYSHQNGSKERIQSKKLNYLKIETQDQFELIKHQLPSQLTSGYFNPKNKEKVYLAKELPFRNMIFIFLILMSSILISIYRALVFKNFNRLFMMLRKTQKIAP